MNDRSSTSYFNITLTCTYAGATSNNIFIWEGREARGDEALRSLARSAKVHFKCNAQSQKDEYLGSSSPLRAMFNLL